MLHNEMREAGLRVFALHEVRNGKCLCGSPHCPEHAAGKHPVASSWQHTPQWSDEQWDAICEYQITTGYGILCKGLLVIDVDARNGGLESLEDLIAEYPEIPGAGMIVATGSGDGSRHYYFRAPDDAALVQHLPDLPGLDFKSSGYVVGPGSLHRSGKTYDLVHGGPDDLDEAPAALIEALRKPERHRTEYDGIAIDVSHSDLAEMLKHVDPDSDYETWIRCGMAVHHASGGTAFETWDAWSAGGAKYRAENMETHWHSFGRSANPVTIGTLVHYAEQGGWKMPVTFTPEVSFDFTEDVAGQDGPRKDGLPFDLAGVDLKSPPGFVGDLARWIEDQCRRPRLNLSVAAALMCVANCAGLRYTDDRDGVNTNLFVFCVAGSRTGKETPNQTIAAVMKHVGAADATHGTIKSEQEIIRNLTRHQAAFYVADEIGLLLSKIQNATARGGAVYLDGVIATLMSAYSKADGFMLVSGDVKATLRETWMKELAQVNKRIEDGDGDRFAERQSERLEHSLKNIDQGLEKPFLSLIGFTTPVTFETLVDYQSATNGFIGRSLIFNERDTAPRHKKGFRKTPFPDQIKNALQTIYNAGEFDMMADGRVEYYGPRHQVPTTDSAHDMLDAVADWFDDEAIKHKSASGLEALFLGAYELVSKVSLVLAVPEGLRTAEHVRWAFALVRRDVEEKALLVTANDRVKDAPKKALQSRILAVIGDDDGETTGVIHNRCRSFKRSDVDLALAELAANKVILKSEAKHPKTGRVSVRYSKT